MSSTLTFVLSYDFRNIVTVSSGQSPQWLTSATQYWIGDVTRPEGIQPSYSLDFGYIVQPAGINLDLGNFV